MPAQVTSQQGRLYYAGMTKENPDACVIFLPGEA
jgi:hypothetical protein